MLRSNEVPFCRNVSYRLVEKLYTVLLGPRAFTLLHKVETNNCEQSHCSKLPTLRKLGKAYDLKNEIKTLVFKAYVDQNELMIAFHIPATFNLPAKISGGFEYSKLKNVILEKSGIYVDRLSYYPNLKFGCLNPINLTIENKNIYHFFQACYIVDQEQKFLTTNAGSRLLGVVIEAKTIFNFLKKYKANYYFFDYK